jgi:predicted nucleic acid-binding protein
VSAGILLDTSVWICYLKAQGWEELKQEVLLALDRQLVHTCWVVRAELLQGARSEVAFEQLDASLAALPQVDLTDQLWLESSRLAFVLRGQGLSLPLTDLLVAQASMTGSLTLWHLDRHYETIRQYTSLRTHSFLS